VKDLEIKIDNDFHLKIAMSDDMKFTEMRLKFMDYFDWAMVETMDQYADKMDNCANECKLSDKVDMCCTTVKMYEKNGDRSYLQYQCMDQAVSDFSSGIWIEEYYYEYTCKMGDWDGNNTYRSGAKSLAVGAATFLLAVSML
jgi:hypothetical protein